MGGKEPRYGQELMDALRFAPDDGWSLALFTSIFLVFDI